MDISLIVCSFNGKERIRGTLDSLLKLHRDNLNVELVFVDNCSTDGVRDYVHSYWNNQGSPFDLKIIIENKSGLFFARKSGVLASNGKFLVFCDDDNQLERNFLLSVYQNLSERLEIGILGSTGTRELGVVFPNWFNDLQEFYAVGCKIKASRQVETVYGAGMAIRRDLMIDFYNLFYGKLTGRSGKQLSSGEDTEICLAIQWMGYSVFWQVDNTFVHAIPESRLNKSYCFKLVSAMAKSQLRIEGLRSIIYSKPFPYKKRFFRDILWIFWHAIHCFSNKRRTSYLVWVWYRYNFWKETLICYTQLPRFNAINYWINTKSELFTKYSKHS